MALYETSIMDALSQPAEGALAHWTHTAEPVWTKLAPTTDRGRFFDKDTIASAEVPSHGPLVRGLSSRSVKHCRLSAGQKPQIRTIGATGITGGFVSGAEGSTEVQRGAHKATVQARRNLRTAQREAANVRKQAKRNALVAELRARGYAVR